MSELTDPPFDTRETEMPASRASSAPIPTFTAEDKQKSKSPRKQRRVGPDGRLLRRMVLALPDSAYGIIWTAITTRTSPLFVRACGGVPVPSTGNQDEDLGAALALICEDWTAGVTQKNDE